MNLPFQDERTRKENECAGELSDNIVLFSLRYSSSHLWRERYCTSGLFRRNSNNGRSDNINACVVEVQTVTKAIQAKYRAQNRKKKLTPLHVWQQNSVRGRSHFPTY